MAQASGIGAVFTRMEDGLRRKLPLRMGPIAGCRLPESAGIGKCILSRRAGADTGAVRSRIESMRQVGAARKVGNGFLHECRIGRCSHVFGCGAAARLL